MKILRMPKNRLKATAYAVATTGFALVLGAPLLASADTTAVNSTINSVISESSGSTVQLTATPTGAGVQTTASDTVTVSTNDTNGYDLTLAETVPANTTLSDGTHTIAASAGVEGTSSAALTSNHWGYHVDSLGDMGTGGGVLNSAAIGSVKYAKVQPSTADTIKHYTTGTATNDTTSVWYSIAVNTSQEASTTYTNNVTYTATGL